MMFSGSFRNAKQLWGRGMEQDIISKRGNKTGLIFATHSLTHSLTFITLYKKFFVKQPKAFSCVFIQETPFLFIAFSFFVIPAPYQSTG